jgi:YVTN family beta-propeller protein
MAHRMGRTGRSSRRSGAVAAIVAAFAALFGTAATSASAAPLVWTANPSTESVSTIDSGTGKPVGNPIHLGIGPEFPTRPVSVALTPNGREAVLADGKSGVVTVIDTATREVMDEFKPFWLTSEQVAVAPDGKAAYVTANAVEPTPAGGEGVWSINPEYPGAIQITPVGGKASAIAVTPDGDYAYVGVAPDQIKTIYTRSGHVVGEPIPVEGLPTSIVFTPDGATAYVVSEGVDAVQVLDTARKEVVETIPTAVEPSSVAVSPDGKHLYIGTESPGVIRALDIPTNASAGAFIVPAGVKEVAVAPDGKTLWAAGSQVSRITLASEKVETIPGTGETSALVVAPDQSPTAVFSPPSPTALAPAVFDGAESTDPDGTIASWNWTFGDGGAGTGVTALHAYGAPGTYTAKLSVVDSEGCGAEEVFTGRTAYCGGSAPAFRQVTVGASAAVSEPPSNKFRVGRIVHNRRNGTVRMQVKLPSAGFVLLFGKKVHAVTRKSKGVQTMWLTIHARVELNKRLKKVLRAPVRVRLTFTPNGGTARTIHRSVVLQRAPRGKHRAHAAHQRRN